MMQLSGKDRVYLTASFLQYKTLMVGKKYHGVGV